MISRLLVFAAIAALAACAKQPQPMYAAPVASYTTPSVPATVSPPSEDPALRLPGPGYVRLNETPTGIGFVHLPTAERNGDVVGLWTVSNFRPAVRDAAGLVGASIRVREEFDCRRRLMRSLSFTAFTGYSLGGRALDTHAARNTNWANIAPDSVGEVKMQMGCEQTGWTGRAAPRASSPTASPSPRRATQPF